MKLGKDTEGKILSLCWPIHFPLTAQRRTLWPWNPQNTRTTKLKKYTKANISYIFDDILGLLLCYFLRLFAKIFRVFWVALFICYPGWVSVSFSWLSDWLVGCLSMLITQWLVAMVGQGNNHNYHQKQYKWHKTWHQSLFPFPFSFAIGVVIFSTNLHVTNAKIRPTKERK